ncbi:MAG: hypothetical protein WCY05_08100 [Candidatus Omnitrophota bacterium]
MKVQKDKCNVRIFCTDGSIIKGIVFVDEGLRVSDFLNNREQKFIILLNVEVQNVPEVHSFKLASEMSKPKKVIFVNKDAVKCIEEL